MVQKYRKHRNELAEQQKQVEDAQHSEEVDSKRSELFRAIRKMVISPINRSIDKNFAFHQ
jgi:hypothetical protein